MIALATTGAGSRGFALKLVEIVAHGEVCSSGQV
jgi:hypothetical protein